MIFLNSFSIRLPKLRYKKLTTTDKLFIFVLISFIVGYIIGVIVTTTENTAFYNISKNIFDKSLVSKSSLSFANYSLQSFLFFIPYIFGTYFCGTSAFGCAAIPIICVTRGVFNGVLISYIYSTYNLIGIGYTVFVLAPYYIFTAFIILLACRESLCFSERILKNTLPNGTAANFFNDYKLYSLRYVFILFLCVLASLLDAGLTSLFFKYFNF